MGGLVFTTKEAQPKLPLTKSYSTLIACGCLDCVDFIEPEGDEIRKWLLFNGVDNDIVPAYSGYRVYEKVDIFYRNSV